MSLIADNEPYAISRVIESDLKKTIKNANTIQKINL